jgi:hypothetical protein
MEASDIPDVILVQLRGTMLGAANHRALRFLVGAVRLTCIPPQVIQAIVRLVFIRIMARFNPSWTVMLGRGADESFED